MNGRRRFLVGTVLSIQNSSFIYPACQNCCSRLILTSCRYECHKCGTTCKAAGHRYKLCVKVSEERSLHVITMFGTSLEKIFGVSADSLHSHLQVSSQLSGDLERHRAQELLFQAAEHCLIGRSFIFAVKIPQNFDRSNSLSQSNVHQNIIASQIILHNDDPMSCTVLSYFNGLVASILSSHSIQTKTDSSTDTTNRDVSHLGFSESSSSLHRSCDHYSEYWQQSLGLVSSPLSNTLAESQDECSRAERVLYPEPPPSPNTTECTQRKLNSTDMATHSSSISTPRVKCSSFKHIRTNADRSQSSSPSHSFSSKSKMALGQEWYLQDVCKSGSCRSQSCSARTMQLPSQTAEIHQAKEEIWEDFPFSESLSEFIAKIEDGEALGPHFIAKESKPITSIEEKPLNEQECRRPGNWMNFPDAQSTQSDTMVKASHCDFDQFSNNESNMSVFNHHCKVKRMDDTVLFDQTFPSEVLKLASFQESIEKSPWVVLSTKEQDRQSPPCRKVLLNSGDSLDMCIFLEDLDKSAMSLENLVSSRRDYVDDKLKSSDVNVEKVRSEVKSTMSGDHYNASADLFEDTNNSEEVLEGSSPLQRIGSPNRSQGRLPISLTDSPCTDVLPYGHRGSRTSVSSLPENYETWNNLITEDFIPYLQSTPVLRRLSGTSRLTVDPWCFKMASKSSIVSVRTKSSRTIGQILLKTIRRRKSSIFYGPSDNYSLWSPNLAPFPNTEASTALIPKNRRSVLTRKPFKRENVLGSNEKPHDGLTCTVRRSDCRNPSGDERINRGGHTLESMSPVNRSLQDAEDQLTSVQKQLPSDWSPELFSGKSNISQSTSGLQRRLF
ncbi:DNA damage-induced apoptosis suppressor protein [Rhinoderma darwinii]|uniref:DNA damage-induced apoptosis suppressor protein n=1 Tax=Rhinoderma darwinii TaxID=43563 RepID=UPI003F673E55